MSILLEFLPTLENDITSSGRAGPGPTDPYFQLKNTEIGKARFSDWYDQLLVKFHSATGSDQQYYSPSKLLSNDNQNQGFLYDDSNQISQRQGSSPSNFKGNINIEAADVNKWPHAPKMDEFSFRDLFSRISDLSESDHTWLFDIVVGQNEVAIQKNHVYEILLLLLARQYGHAIDHLQTIQSMWFKFLAQERNYMCIYDKQTTYHSRNNSPVKSLSQSVNDSSLVDEDNDLECDITVPLYCSWKKEGVKSDQAARLLNILGVSRSDIANCISEVKQNHFYFRDIMRHDMDAVGIYLNKNSYSAIIKLAVDKMTESMEKQRYGDSNSEPLITSSVKGTRACTIL